MVITYSKSKDQPGKMPTLLVVNFCFFSFFFFHLTYSRWTSSSPSCLWSLRIFSSLPSSRLTFFYRDASSALLQLVNQWLNFTYSRSHAFRYERTQILLNRENEYFPVPVRASEFGLARRVQPSRPASASSFSILRLSLVLTHGIPPDFRGGVH